MKPLRGWKIDPDTVIHECRPGYRRATRDDAGQCSGPTCKEPFPVWVRFIVLMKAMR